MAHRLGARGSSVEHISHERKDGWFRNVHAGHATVLGELPDEAGVDKDGDDCVAEETEGSDDDRCCDTTDADVVNAGTDDRGTPHSPQILAAAGLKPGGLRYAHTSHSQLSNPVSTSSLVPRSDATELPDRWSVILADDLNRPA